PAVRAELGLPVRAPLAVCVARLSRQKGQDVLLRAWPAVRRGCPAALLALVGDGPLDGPSPDGVLRVGPVADPRPWLVAADVAVFPSRWEGLCLGLLEAMAVGRSTVVSAIPGLLEVVDHRVGAAVPAGQVGPLADTLLARLADPALAAAEGDAAARRAPAFDVQRTHQRVADLTELALEAHQRPPMSWRSRCAERGLSGHSNTPCGQ
ncbi:MAG TPA: glycosyltransferase family 4 protein, partial [Streptosporangiaceae bacterium]